MDLLPYSFHSKHIEQGVTQGHRTKSKMEKRTKYHIFSVIQ